MSFIHTQATGSSHVGSESTNNSMDVDGRSREDLGGANVGSNIIPATNRVTTTYCVMMHPHD
jgi:hypothetical protein